ncbi:MAG: LytTR family transcriptional regulator [Ruminiclostridium sp.]|nr:LytTR family transcriptional regulator [Ruminiclostridium sp.]
MKFEVLIDKNCKEPKIIIHTDKMTDEIGEIIKRISETYTDTITAFSQRGAEIVECKDILSIFSENQKIHLQTEKEKYTVNARLYELEEKLDSKIFIRISNSEIVNIRKIIHMDVSLAGTICIFLQGNFKAYVSRRYVPRIKKVLGIRR